MGRKKSGIRGDVRQSALWGSGNRGGELRSSALWGKGGRGIATTVIALALTMPLAASAAPSKGRDKPSKDAFVSQGLKERAKNRPNDLIRVIIQSDAGYVGATDAANKALGKLKHRFEFIDSVAVELRAKQIERLQQIPGLIVTEDAVTRKSGYTSSQLWTAEAGINKLWNGPKAPTIAIVDSGIDRNHPSFGNGARIIDRQVFVKTNNSLSNSDGRGHGTFVAGIAAGEAAGFAGVAPNANLIDLDVMDDSGSGLTSDVIAATEWIYQNHRAKNIRVVNYSLHSSGTANFYNDPLNRAVEKLWFDGVVVVAAAGNYGVADGASGVRHAPGNDPFVITVGALDIGGTAKVGDDDRAPWSAYGYTRDGFSKPEICAAGRYMVSAIPMSSTLAGEKADKIRKSGYIELSGTSFAAPVVAGVAAQLLARFPEMTPDEVKGTLMRRVKPVPNAEPGACGVGQINATRTSFEPSKTANPNAGINRYVGSVSGGSGRSFDAVSWNAAAKADVSWNAVSWNAVSWNDVSWNAVSWNAVSWNAVSWNDVSWNDSALSDTSKEDGADGDPGNGGEGYELTPEEAAAAAADPELLAPGETLPAAPFVDSLLQLP